MSATDPAGAGADGIDDEDSRFRADLADRLEAELAAAHGPATSPEQVAARRLGQSVRSLIDVMTAVSAPPELIEEMATEVDAVAARLQGYHQTLRRYEGSSEGSGLAHDRAFFDWSPQLGLSNPLAPPIRVAVEDGHVVGRATFGIAYEGPPGCVHGGYIAAAFDEVLGLTQSLSGRVGMTGTLTVRYRRPTPLNRELRFEGRVTAVAGRKVTVTALLYAGEDLTAEATGLFVTISPDRFRALAANRERPQPD